MDFINGKEWLKIMEYHAIMTYNINIDESSQKKIIVEALKTMICNNNPEPQAIYLCNQLDDASCIADCLEEIFKQLRSYYNNGL